MEKIVADAHLPKSSVGRVIVESGGRVCLWLCELSILRMGKRNPAELVEDLGSGLRTLGEGFNVSAAGVEAGLIRKGYREGVSNIHRTLLDGVGTRDFLFRIKEIKGESRV